MAGRGPAPKDPAQRRRRNDATKDFDELPAEGFTGTYPPLPDCYEMPLGELDPEDDEPLTIEVAYRPETLEWYQAFATSPMATRFLATDWARLRFVIAPIFDRAIRSAGDTKVAAELRLQEERLGATVMDRQRLRWTVASEPAEKKPTAKATKTRSANARRARLRAVS